MTGLSLDILDRCGAPDMQVFHDVPVLPFSSLDRLPYFGDGGPVWPDFDSQTSARHNRNGTPADNPPIAPAPEPEPVRGDFVWGGYAQPHFGHLVAEHLTRLPVSTARRPDDVYLFTVHPRRRKDPPAFFYDLCDWFGLPKSQVRLVRNPMTAETLRVAPQAEQLTRATPAPYALALADATAARNGVRPVANDVVYVARTGLVRRGKGGHAGEEYLCDVLRRAGVTIMDPAALSLVEQVGIYSGARHLVFAEGSAMHGRQLIGYRPQTISILNRRQGFQTARSVLAPRADDVTYVESTVEVLAVGRAKADNDTLNMTSALSILDTDAAFTLFSRLGHDISGLWDPDAYKAAARADVLDWAQASCDRLGQDKFSARSAHMAEALARLGWSDLFRQLKPASTPKRLHRGRRHRVGGNV